MSDPIAALVNRLRRHTASDDERHAADVIEAGAALAAVVECLLEHVTGYEDGEGEMVEADAPNAVATCGVCFNPRCEYERAKEILAHYERAVAAVQ